MIKLKTSHNLALARHHRELRRRTSAFLGCLVLLATLAGLTGPNPCQAEQFRTAQENKLEAAFFFNFAQFARWPAATFTSPNAPLVIGVFSDEQIMKGLEPFHNKTIDGRPVEFHNYGLKDLSGNCHLLFIPSSQERSLKRILKAIGQHPILTVSEIPGFVEKGGMIGLIHDKGRIRFEINLHTTRQTGLDLSSHLLRLATRCIGLEN